MQPISTNKLLFKEANIPNSQPTVQQRNYVCIYLATESEDSPELAKLTLSVSCRKYVFVCVCVIVLQ
jgi:hypothetical protein